VIGSTPTVPISIALVAGGLAVVNPCGFPLLPAFLSFSLGADEQRLPMASSRALQGLLVGALVTVGFLGFFALVGLPVSYGVAAIARAVPWAGLATGAALAPSPGPGSPRAPRSRSRACSHSSEGTSACRRT
jgi:cytochrome c-type biogenesis protein